MTDIRRRGFSSLSEFDERMEEIIDGSDDAGVELGREREAEIELAWLRKEVENLREQLAIARGQAVGGKPLFQDQDKWVPIVGAVTAALFCVVLAKRV